MTIEGPAGSQAATLLCLMTWLSPAFPVGAFAFSHGLEAAIAEGAVGNGEAVADWTRTLLLRGSGWNDLVLFAEGFRAAAAGDADRFREAADLARALAGSAERRAETLALGQAFARACAPWSGELDAEAPAYPLAVARLAAAHGLPLTAALTAFAHGFSANLVAAATRLVPLGQSASVAALKRLEPTVLEAASRAASSDLCDLGSAAILSDIAAMRHETLATRLFRT